MLPIVVVVSAVRAAIIATAPASRVATPPLEQIREGVATTIESGSRIWDSGRALHAYLAADASLVGRSVVELGSGTGIGGLGAAASGAHVVLSDLPEQLPLIRSNIISCGLEADVVRDAARITMHRHASPNGSRHVPPHAASHRAPACCSFLSPGATPPTPLACAGARRPAAAPSTLSLGLTSCTRRRGAPRYRRDLVFRPREASPCESQATLVGLAILWARSPLSARRGALRCSSCTRRTASVKISSSTRRAKPDSPRWAGQKSSRRESAPRG